MVDILRLAPETITPLWSQLEPMVAKALGRILTHDTEDVRASLLSMQSVMFARINEGIVESFIITQFAQHPKGLWLHIWLAASLPTVKFDIMAFRTVANQWRARNRCRGFQISGARDGWIKKLDGRLEGVTMRITLE